MNFTVNEGTWMNLDVSPDGSTIIFDLLGDIYALPSNIGMAYAKIYSRMAIGPYWNGKTPMDFAVVVFSG